MIDTLKINKIKYKLTLKNKKQELKKSIV